MRSIRIIADVIGFAIPTVVADYLPWLVAGLIVALGLGVYGARDWLRFSLSRAWSISGVVFTESMRKRVLLVVLVAIPGIIIIAQFQNPLDEQDAIRQTTKICLFACGIVVVSTAIILACTNLPREIESRVIFTVVTKPTTRLEIVLGKIIGFARVSAMVLLVMGLFTYGYLTLRANRMMSFINTQLESKAIDPNKRVSLDYYKQAGLLAARVYETAYEPPQFYSRVPEIGDETHYMFGGDGSFALPFTIPLKDLFLNGKMDTIGDIAIDVLIGTVATGTRKVNANPSVPPTTLPYLVQNPTATLDQVSLTHGAAKVEEPAIAVDILDPTYHAIVEPSAIGGGHPTPVVDPTGRIPTRVRLSTEGVKKLIGNVDMPDDRMLYIQIAGTTAEDEYFVGAKPVVLHTVDGRTMEPAIDSRTGKTAEPIFHGRAGTIGQQLRGDDKNTPVALYRFKDAKLNATDGQITFETNVAIERSESDTDEERPTKLEVVVRDHNTGKLSDPVNVYPESRRTAYFHLPVSAIPGKDFDLLIKCLTPGHFVSLSRGSLLVVSDNQSFIWNLAKSLFVLWLLTLLVVIVAVFASTFVSWPIAIVLTVLILLGHWGVEQLGDSLAPGLGNAIATDLGVNQANVARTVSESVDALSKMLNVTSMILPDISRFSAIEDLEGGMAVPWMRISDSLGVLAMFGLPMTVLAYVFLRRKEVAP